MNLLDINQRQVLTVGPRYKPPKGGIAQTMYTYEQQVFNEFRYVENSTHGSRIAKLWCLFSALARFVWICAWDRNIKIVHIHTASNFSFRRSMWFVNLARLCGKKTILHIHGGGFKKFYNANKNSVRKSLMRCDVVVALTRQWRDFFTVEVGLPNVQVINNVVPPPSCVNTEHDNYVHVLYLGLISQKKGVFDLIETVGKHIEQFENLRIHLAGTGEEKQIQKMHSLIDHYGLDNLIAFEGWVDGEKKDKLLSICNVFILPSYIEGLPISILEAMAARMAILATNVGGIPSIVKNQVNGFLFNPGDQEQMARLLKKMMNEPDMLNEMREQSFQMVQPFFPEAVAEQLACLYYGLLNE